MENVEDAQAREAAREHIERLVGEGRAALRALLEWPANADAEARRSLVRILDRLQIEGMAGESDLAAAAPAIVVGAEARDTFALWARLLEAAAPNRSAMRMVCRGIVEWKAALRNDSARAPGVIETALREYHGSAGCVIEAVLAGLGALDEPGRSVFLDLAARVVGYLEPDACAGLFRLAVATLDREEGRAAAGAVLECMSEKALLEQRAAVRTLERMARASHLSSVPAQAAYFAAVSAVAVESLSSAEYLALHLLRRARRTSDATAYITVARRLLAALGAGAVGTVIRDVPDALERTPDRAMAWIETAVHIAEAYGRQPALAFIQSNPRLARVTA